MVGVDLGEDGAQGAREGAGWLERPDRDAEERPDLLMQALSLKPGRLRPTSSRYTGAKSFRELRT